MPRTPYACNDKALAPAQARTAQAEPSGRRAYHEDQRQGDGHVGPVQFGPQKRENAADQEEKDRCQSMPYRFAEAVQPPVKLMSLLHPPQSQPDTNAAMKP
jgi:hypothetical protein